MKQRITRFLRLYWIFTGQFIKRLLEYRADFLTGALAFFLGQFFNLVFIAIIFGNIPQLEGFEVDALGELLTGIVLICIAAQRLALNLTLLKVAGGVLAVLFGTLIYTGIKIVFASIALWTKQSGSLLHMIYMTSDFAKYPVTIYNHLVKTVVTYVIPFAFTAFYPAAWLLTGKQTLFSLGGTVIAGTSLVVLGRLIWNRGLSAYESAGS